MAHYKFCKDIEDKKVPATAKVAIVGAGMSGLYSAWRLKEECNEDDVVIFERSDRTGGRLDSDIVKFNNFKQGPSEPDTIEVKEEQGGMRFLFEDMDDLMALFLKLDLQNDIVPFPMNSGGNNRLYFRGESFSVEEAKQDNYQIWSELYNLAPSEQGVNPKDIVNVVFNRILQANPDFTRRPENKGPEFWQAFRIECCWNDKPLFQWSLWDLFSDMGYTQECVTMLYRILGFNGTFLSKMNAGVAYQLLEDFPADVKFKTFKDGFSTLPNTLVDRVGKDKIHLQTSIEAIAYDELREQYILTYQHTDKDGKVVKETMRAEKVILGLPRLALEKLFVKSDAFNNLPTEKSQKLWDTLQSASNQPLLKINLYYENAWWGNGMTGRPSVAFGPNFADLPTGSVYPFYAVNDELAASLIYQEHDAESTPSAEVEAKLSLIAKEKYAKPAALTIYCDYLNINFWSALQSKGEAYHSPQQDKFITSVPEDMHPATDAVVKEATRFFKSIFNTHYVPEPVLTSARIWEGSVEFDLKPSQQFGYGVHQWAIGANDEEVIKDLVEPMPNLFTCGEAFSDYQGWVEGALRSTDLALEKGFGLKPLSKVYHSEHGISSSEAIQIAYKENATSLIREYIDPSYTPGVQVHASEADLDTCMGVDLTYFDRLKEE